MPLSRSILRPRFNPKMIGGLALWLDANDSSTITLNSTTVSEWRDKSGNARHAAQATAALQPTFTANAVNGKSALTLTGSQFIEVAAFPIKTYMAGVAVASIGGNAQSLLQRGGINDVHSVFASSTNIIGRVGGGTDSSVSYSSGTRYVITFKIFFPRPSGTSSTLIRVNGTPGTLATVSQGPSSSDRALAIGGLSSSVYLMTGDVCEIAYYQTETELTDGEISQLESYAAKRWGITL